MTDLRLSDAERAEAAQVLADHHVAGRLDVEEHEDRVARAWTARYAADLRPLFDDLPAPHPAAIGGSPVRRADDARDWNAPRHDVVRRRPPGRAARRTWSAGLGVVLLAVFGLTALGEVGALLVLLPIAVVFGFLFARRMS